VIAAQSLKRWHFVDAFLAPTRFPGAIGGSKVCLSIDIGLSFLLTLLLFLDYPTTVYQRKTRVAGTCIMRPSDKWRSWARRHLARLSHH
jgi:hypothetical protein